MRFFHIGAHRLLATGALLLASSLEICGCNPVRDCQTIRNLQMSSLDWQTLLERCSECLTAKQVNTLEQGQGRFAVAGTTVPFRSGETVGQALEESDRPSFYDPTPNAASLAATQPVSDFSSLEPSSLFERVTPSEIKFAPWSIPESVLFLYKESESAEIHRRMPTATAFVLSVPDRNRRTLARFLVTARHVVDPTWAHCAEQNPASMQLRLNRRSGGVGYETIRLFDEHGQPRFLTPEDDTADIAIIRLDRQLIPNLESYKFVDTPFRLLPTDSELGYISSRHRDEAHNEPGQPVTTASLRTQVPADLSAFPISQSGVLFSTAAEPVNIQCGGKPALRPLRVWFIDASVEQGVSGAPVYTSLLRDGDVSPSTILLGVQAIAWPDRGVAGITPAFALARLVESALATADPDASPQRGIHAADRNQFASADLYRGGAP